MARKTNAQLKEENAALRARLEVLEAALAAKNSHERLEDRRDEAEIPENSPNVERHLEIFREMFVHKFSRSLSGFHAWCQEEYRKVVAIEKKYGRLTLDGRCRKKALRLAGSGVKKAMAYTDAN